MTDWKTSQRKAIAIVGDLLRQVDTWQTRNGNLGIQGFLSYVIISVSVAVLAVPIAFEIKITPRLKARLRLTCYICLLVVFKQETARQIRFPNILIRLAPLQSQQKFVAKTRISAIRKHERIRA